MTHIIQYVEVELGNQ